MAGSDEGKNAEKLEVLSSRPRVDAFLLAWSQQGLALKNASKFST